MEENIGHSILDQQLYLERVRAKNNGKDKGKILVPDLDGNGKLDIVAPGKDGLYVFKNRGFAVSMGDM